MHPEVCRVKVNGHTFPQKYRPITLHFPALTLQRDIVKETSCRIINVGAHSTKRRLPLLLQPVAGGGAVGAAAQTRAGEEASLRSICTALSREQL